MDFISFIYFFSFEKVISIFVSLSIFTVYYMTLYRSPYIAVPILPKYSIFVKLSVFWVKTGIGVRTRNGAIGENSKVYPERNQASSYKVLFVLYDIV